MKYSENRIAGYVVLMILSIFLAFVWGYALVHKEVGPGDYQQTSPGFEYRTETGERTNVHFYSAYDFAVECDGEIINAEANGLPTHAYYKFKQVKECHRVVTLVGSPTIRPDEAMTGFDIYPANNIFAMAVVVLAAIFLWGWVCFYLVK